ncbi:hypothetical protein COV18_07070 [Candidatus Woesearchaeota archaeon CG10_big_fil_rev_8_21_14_0_10_37_12]|nr:MAG: hypothetical protein COV18_07070 [Candidatus Woesearchaeota archaeon CG10_big_fil_rev_8_21_14_0_10_37_12]
MKTNIWHVNHKKAENVLDTLFSRIGAGDRRNISFGKKTCTLQLHGSNINIKYSDISFIVPRRPLEIYLKNDKIEQYERKGFDVHKTGGVITLNTNAPVQILTEFHEKDVEVR